MKRKPRKRAVNARAMPSLAEALDYHALVERRLYDAGKTLMMLQSSVGPAEPRSHWPEVMRTYWDMFAPASPGEDRKAAEVRRNERAEDKLKPRLVATSKAMTRLDEVLGWLWYLEPVHRKIIFARMLINPLTDKHVFSWRQIQGATGIHRDMVKRRFKVGIDQIVKELAESS